MGLPYEVTYSLEDEKGNLYGSYRVPMEGLSVRNVIEETRRFKRSLLRHLRSMGEDVERKKIRITGAKRIRGNSGRYSP